MLYFNYDKFDFWPVYDRIGRFYPIGIRKEESGRYHAYPGLKELEAILVANLHDDGHYMERWKDFTGGISRELGLEVGGTTYGQAPSFSAFVLLQGMSVDNLKRRKELHFFVSLVGPFYTVIGVDRNTVVIQGGKYRSTSYLVVSPEHEFAGTFRSLCERIESRFEGFRFLPFNLCRQTVNGLDVHYMDEKGNTVFHALFNHLIDLSTPRTIGNGYYKSGDWIREGYVGDGGRWEGYPPNT